MNIQHLPLDVLRTEWEKAWGRKPHVRIGRVMLEKSLTYKLNHTPNPEQEKRLKQLIKDYKRNPKCFDERVDALKPGTRLVRNYNGIKHNVIVKAQGFEYNGKDYSSLSQIANDITGKRWNGWVFFGLKKI
jgi:hypothetical protein